MVRFQGASLWGLEVHTLHHISSCVITLFLHPKQPGFINFSIHHVSSYFTEMGYSVGYSVS